MTDVIPIKRRDATSLGELEAGDKIPSAYFEAQPPSLYGTYVGRPAASSVPAGTLYFSTDTRDCHRSAGGLWVIAGSGGDELGYAERTSAFSTASTTLTDVTGLTVTTKVGERPLAISFGGNLRSVGGGAITFALLINGSVRSQVVYSGTSYMFMGRTARISDLTAGSVPTIKLQMSVSSGSAEVYGANGDRPSLLVVNM